MEECYVSFTEDVTNSSFNMVTDIFKARLGDRVEIENERLADRTVKYTYRTVIMLVIIMTVIATFNYMMLYLYIMDKRKKEFAICMICGMWEGRAVLHCIAECLIITVPFYLIANMVFTFILMPGLRYSFPYMQAAFSPMIYAVFFVIYIVVTILVGGASIRYKLSDIKAVLSGGR